LLAAKAPDAASKGQNMLNHFAAVIAWGRTNGTPGAGMLPTPVSISKTRRNISPPKPIANVLAGVSMENLLNVDYTKYMCWRTAAGYVVSSPGNPSRDPFATA
jgi:hypothetical protein